MIKVFKFPKPLYPPGKGMVNLLTIFYTFWDLAGRVIYTNFINEASFEKYIPLNHLSNGLYLITVSKGKEVIYKEKLIKE